MDNQDRLKLWLASHGLLADPFATYTAEEEEYLPRIWVDPPHYFAVMNTDKIRPTFLFGARGEGKTATRQMVEYECKKGLRGEVLAVPFFDFSRLLAQTGNNLKELTTQQVVGEIIRAILKVLADGAIPVGSYERMDETNRGILAAYNQEFSAGFSRTKLQKIIGGTPVDVDWTEFSPFETLSNLTEIITHLLPFSGKKESLKAIYLLFDRMDETKAGPEAAIDILRPIVTDGPVLETPRVSFKFFVRQDLEERIMSELPIRADRVEIVRIGWDMTLLEKLVNRRLENFSNSAVTGFSELVEEKAKFKGLNKLIDHCETSPRLLLQMCSDVLLAHASQSSDPTIKLDLISDVILNHKREKEASQPIEVPAHAEGQEEAAVETHASTQQGKENEPPQADSGLHIEANGTVTVDGVIKPLTNKEQALLEILYTFSPAILPVEQLLRGVWGSNEGGRTDLNLRKLIGRLRLSLEPNSTPESSRFIKNVKGRGYYLLMR